MKSNHFIYSMKLVGDEELALTVHTVPTKRNKHPKNKKFKTGRQVSPSNHVQENIQKVSKRVHGY